MADEKKPFVNPFPRRHKKEYANLTFDQRVAKVLRSQGHRVSEAEELPKAILDCLAELCDETGKLDAQACPKSKAIFDAHYDGLKAVVDGGELYDADNPNAPKFPKQVFKTKAIGGEVELAGDIALGSVKSDVPPETQ